MEIIDMISEILLMIILLALGVSSVIMMLDIRRTQKKAKELDAQFEKVIHDLAAISEQEKIHLEKMKKATKKTTKKTTKKVKAVKAE